MVQGIAEGARSVGDTVDVKRVPELVPPEVAKSSHFKTNQAAPVATVDELPSCDRHAARRPGEHDPVHAHGAALPRDGARFQGAHVARIAAKLAG
jgi:hypothetical protein